MIAECEEEKGRVSRMLALIKIIGGLHYPIPSSSEDSSAVPQRRQMTDEQSPQVSGSFTSSAQFGQYREPDSGLGEGFSGRVAMRRKTVA